MRAQVGPFFSSVEASICHFTFYLLVRKQRSLTASQRQLFEGAAGVNNRAVAILICANCEWTKPWERIERIATTMDVWSKALQNLDPDDRARLTASQDDPQSTLASPVKEAQAKRDEAHRKRWKFTRKDGSTVILRDVFEKIVYAISKYSQVVDVAVNAAPLYAAPPWAAVRFLLQVNETPVAVFCWRP